MSLLLLVCIDIIAVLRARGRDSSLFGPMTTLAGEQSQEKNEQRQRRALRPSHHQSHATTLASMLTDFAASVRRCAHISGGGGRAFRRCCLQAATQVPQPSCDCSSFHGLSRSGLARCGGKENTKAAPRPLKYRIAAVVSAAAGQGRFLEETPAHGGRGDALSHALPRRSQTVHHTPPFTFTPAPVSAGPMGWARTNTSPSTASPGPKAIPIACVALSPLLSWQPLCGEPLGGKAEQRSSGRAEPSQAASHRVPSRCVSSLRGTAAHVQEGVEDGDVRRSGHVPPLPQNLPRVLQLPLLKRESPAADNDQKSEKKAPHQRRAGWGGGGCVLRERKSTCVRTW